MRHTLQHLFNHHRLSKAEAKQMLIEISEGAYNDAQITAFITVYLMRSISVDELAGFREALLELSVKTDLQAESTIDVCGTGGDGKNTFNISTISSLVVAGAGYKVTKHGNYGVSSSVGSSNVLEHLGYTFTADSDILKRQLEDHNICFLHAPLFHPALKGVANIRKSLGVKTFFNMLGPLVNPVNPKHQLVGVYNLQIAKLYNYLYQKLDKKYTIIHALDGYDEVSLTGKCKLIQDGQERLVEASHFGFKPISPEEIHGGDTLQAAADIFINILNGNGTNAQNQVILCNAALAIHCFDRQKSIPDCIAEAQESLLSGKALQTLKKLTQN